MKEDAPRLPILGFRALTRKIFSLPFLTPSDRSERKQSFLPAQLFFFPFHSNDTEANFECMYAYILPEINKWNRWCTIVKQNDTKFYIFNGPRNFRSTALRKFSLFCKLIALNSTLFHRRNIGMKIWLLLHIVKKKNTVGLDSEWTYVFDVFG